MCWEREGKSERQGLKIECTSVGPCVRERHTKMATKTKAEAERQRERQWWGATNGRELSSALRASVSQTESRSEIS